MTDPLKLVGTTIADKYAVESVVGEGGFAIVYKATHLLWKRPVAVKVFKALGEVDQDQREKLLEDFIQEGRLLADLSERSAAICQARDVGMLTSSRGDTVPYMVLEWLEGRTLDDVLVEERKSGAAPRSLANALRLLAPVAEALGLAHKQGIAHRDVKPANIFVLDGDAGVKLLDFGIAKVVQDAQRMGFGKTAGHITSFTPLYGAPEQFNRQFGATGPWTDVFALALVISEVVTGREPMTGETLVQLAYASTDPAVRPTPRRLGALISEGLDAVFAKAVAVQPAERYQTVGELWAALTDAMTAERSSASLLPRLSMLNTSPSAGAMTAVDPSAVPGSEPRFAPASPTSSANPAKRSPLPVVASVVAGVLVLGAVGFAAVRREATPGPAPTASASAASASLVPTASPSASASAAVPSSCPVGMRLVPGGEFFMGSEDAAAESFEKPAHKVKLAPYCLDELEVTVAKYKACSDVGKCLRAGKQNVWPGIKPAQAKIYDPLCNINDPLAKGEHPINCVDWDQARDYCQGQGGRLPTEAEWELAARGPDGRVYPWGDEAPSAKLLNACGKECVGWQKTHRDPDVSPALMYEDDDGFPNTAPVGSFPAGKSRYGIQDVVGNVWEWTADWYADYDNALATKTTTDPTGPAEGTTKVIRGGAWNGSQPSWVRPSFRFHADKASRSYGFGFRCAKTP